MKILMLPPYCYPEQISSSHLTDDLLEELSKAGIKVDICAPTPCRGISKETRRLYKKINKEKRFNDYVSIRRFPLFAEGKNPVVRAIRYIICNIIQIILGSRLKDIDVIYSSSTPPTQGLMCGIVARRIGNKTGRKIPFVYNLQDVFPDSLASTGLSSKNSFIWKIGRLIENQTYKNADKIIVISEDIKSNILNKGVPNNKIIVIPNWINTLEVKPIPRDKNSLFNEFNINKDKFIIVYAGNLGAAQGIETFIDAAKRINDVEFLIFGEGSCKEEYSERCKGFSNIHMFPMMPRDRVSEVYSMGDMCLVACKKGMGTGAVPSKTFSIMATSTPVLLNYDDNTELWNIISKTKSGICTHAGDVDELVDVIERIKNQKDIIRSMGMNARKCVEREYSKEVGTNKIIELIKNTESLVDSGLSKHQRIIARKGDESTDSNI